MVLSPTFTWLHRSLLLFFTGSQERTSPTWKESFAKSSMEMRGFSSFGGSSSSWAGSDRDSRYSISLEMSILGKRAGPVCTGRLPSMAPKVWMVSQARRSSLSRMPILL